MNKGLLYLAAGIAGAIVGVASSALYFKKKYEAISNEEIASVLKAFEEKTKAEEEPVVKTAKALIEKTKKPEIIELAERIQKESYTNYSNTEKVKAEEEEKRNATPFNSSSAGIEYVDFEDFDTEPGYEKYDLTYYEGDGVLADNIDEIVTDPISALGEGFANCFKNDVLYVRNDIRQCYYEVVRDMRTYQEVVG